MNITCLYWAHLHSRDQQTNKQFIHASRRHERLAAVLCFLLGDEKGQAILEDEATVARCLAGKRSPTCYAKKGFVVVTNPNFILPHLPA